MNTDKKYQVIYADPPWDFGKSSWILTEGGDFGKKGKAIQNKENKIYPTLNKQELMELKINKYQIVYADPPWKYPDSSYTLIKDAGWKDNDKKNKHKKTTTVRPDKIYPTLTKQELMDLKINKYQVIYADPPWKFHLSPDKAYTSKQKFDENGVQVYPRLDIDNQYETLEAKDIAALPIQDFIDKDAACFMWTTDTHMPQALEIMKAWGFTYKTVAFVWEKQTNKGNPVCLLGPWTHKTYEICLFGTKGAMMKHKKDSKIRQMVKAERTIHSKKPQEVADRIVRMFPDCTRIELFARDAKPGWDVWGNEVQSDIEL